MYQDRKQELINRIKNMKLMANYEQNKDKLKNPVQSTLNGIGNAYKAVSGFNKGMEALNKFKQPQLSAIGKAANSSMPINNLGSSIMDGSSIINADTSNLFNPSQGTSAIGDAINSNVLGNTSNIGTSAVGDAVGNAAQGASQGATQATSALSSAAPVVGAGLGLASAGGNFAKGDNVNGALDVAKTGAMFIPGVGWAVSGAIQLGQMIKNMFDKKRQQVLQKGQEEAAKAQQEAIQNYDQSKQGFDELQQENNQKMQEQMQKMQQPQQTAQDNEALVQDIVGQVTGGASDVQQQGYTGNLPNLDKQQMSMPTNYAEENNPTMSPEEMALIEQSQQNPEPTQLEDIKQSLFDRFKSGLSDFGAGYKDNANTDFAHGDLMNGIVSGGAAPAQQGNTFNLGAQANKKSVMARLGELAGTGQRIMAHPLTQAAIAGGISKAAGGNIDDIAKAAFQYGSQKAAADRYYQQVTGNTNRPFLNSYTSQDVTNKRLEDAMNQKQQQWMYEQMIKKAQQDWNNQFNQEKFNYTKQQDKEKNALKRDEINTRKEYYRARGRNDSGNSVAQQKYNYQQGLNKSIGQFQKYADALSKAKEKDGFFANSNDKAAIVKAQEDYDKAREFMINTYGGDFIKYAKEQGWE